MRQFIVIDSDANINKDGKFNVWGSKVLINKNEVISVMQHSYGVDPQIRILLKGDSKEYIAKGTVEGFYKILSR